MRHPRLPARPKRGASDTSPWHNFARGSIYCRPRRTD